MSYYPPDYPNDLQKLAIGAIGSKNESMFSELLQRESSRNSSFYKGLSLLQMTAKGNFVKGVEMLLNDHADPNCKPYHYKKSALDYAVINGNFKMAKLLLERGASPNLLFETDQVKDPTKPRDTECSLGLAIEYDQPGIAVLLLQHGAYTQQYHKGEPLITLAGKMGHPSIAQALCQYGADINAKDSDGNTVLHLASFMNRADLVESLVNDYGANPSKRNNNGDMPIHLAFTHCNKRILTFLSKHSSVFELNCGKKSALDLACDLNNPEAIASLFEPYFNHYGFRSSSLNNYLLSTCRHKEPDATRCLISRVHDINTIDRYGKSALHYVCELGHDKQLDVFLEHKDRLDLNKQDNSKNTPLHYAIQSKNEKMVSLLLENGANPTLQNIHGLDAVHFASIVSGDKFAKFVASEIQKNNPQTAEPVLIAKHKNDMPKQNDGEHQHM